LRGTPRHESSTTTPRASGATTGQSWSNGSWPTLANYADPGTRSRCITFVPSKTSIPRGGNTNPSGSHGWQHAAARPLSSAAPAMKTSTPDVLHGIHDEHWRAGCHGNRARPVRRGVVGKGPGQLAPRRRPTLRPVRFGGGPYGKGPANCGYLAVRPTQSTCTAQDATAGRTAHGVPAGHGRVVGLTQQSSGLPDGRTRGR
jgi:hypothetical protein